MRCKPDKFRRFRAVVSLSRHRQRKLLHLESYLQIGGLLHWRGRSFLLLLLPLIGDTGYRGAELLQR